MTVLNEYAKNAATEGRSQALLLAVLAGTLPFDAIVAIPLDWQSIALHIFLDALE